MSKSNFKKQGVLVGVRNLVFAKVATDDVSGHTYETDIKQAPDVIEIALTAQKTEDQLGANDNPLFEILETNDGYEVSVIQAAMGADKCAFLLGQTVDDNGAVVESARDNPPYVAMGFITARSDGTDDYVWMYKGKFGPGDQTFHTKEQGTVNWQTPTITGKFGPRVHDGKIKIAINTGDESAASVLPTFFDSVYEAVQAQTQQQTQQSAGD